MILTRGGYQLGTDPGIGCGLPHTLFYYIIMTRSGSYYYACHRKVLTLSADYVASCPYSRPTRSPKAEFAPLRPSDLMRMLPSIRSVLAADCGRLFGFRPRYCAAPEATSSTRVHVVQATFGTRHQTNRMSSLKNMLSPSDRPQSGSARLTFSRRHVSSISSRRCRCVDVIGGASS